MFQKLVNHNDDIRRLVDKGYAVGFDSNHLIVRDILYLNNQRQVQIGAIVAKLIFVDNERIIQDDHQVYFAGDVPHNIDGTPIPNLAGGPTTIPLSEAASDVIVQRSFSNKPRVAGKFEDFFEKIESYVGIISGPAIELYNANPYTFRTMETVPESVFKFHDTLTSRAEITDLSANFKNDVIAIIGLGGTGAYILDLLVKTQLGEIRAFDPDVFHVHNAFRSPGKVDESEFGKTKAEVYRKRYENFRHGLIIEPKFIDASSEENFNDLTFAFVCVDKGSSRSGIFDLLISKKIPYIDVGMGLNRKHGSLNGMLRTTYFSAENAQQVRDQRLAETSDNPDDIYRTNIQIGELNALNACLAILKFKQLREFYLNESPNYHQLFKVSDCNIVGESEF